MPCGDLLSYRDDPLIPRTPRNPKICCEPNSNLCLFCFARSSSKLMISEKRSYSYTITDELSLAEAEVVSNSDSDGGLEVLYRDTICGGCNK